MRDSKLEMLVVFYDVVQFFVLVEREPEQTWSIFTSPAKNSI